MKNVRIVTVVDALLDLSEAGYDPDDHYESFIAAYLRAAENLANAVNRDLGEHLLMIEVEEEPQCAVADPPCSEGPNIWQDINDLVINESGEPDGWVALMPAPGVVAWLRERVMRKIGRMERREVAL